MDTPAEAGDAASILSQTSPRKTRKRTPLSRIYRLLVSRLSTPLLTSLVLLPTLPSGNQSIIFELIPFYKSLRWLVLTPSHACQTPQYRKNVQQWLSYWTLYAFVRFLEATRCNVSTSRQRREALQNAFDRLPRILGERILRLFTFARSKTASSESVASRNMTLATQLAGSPLRWTVIKAILLFYAMDEELQGAKRIMQKVIKPFFGFFTSLDDEEEEVMPLNRSIEQHPARRTHVIPDHEEVQEEENRQATSLKLDLAENKEDEDEHIHTPSTPELSMDGSCGGSVDEGNVIVDNDAGSARETIILVKQDQQAVHAATWPLETTLIAVEGNHWVR